MCQSEHHERQQDVKLSFNALLVSFEFEFIYIPYILSRIQNKSKEYMLVQVILA
jgi:hypothetical protein